MKVPAETRRVTLSELQELWELSFEKTTRGISVSDAESGKLRAVNPAFVKMHGGSEAEEFVGRRLSDFLAPSCLARIPEVTEELARSGFAGFESEHLRLDGSSFPVMAELMSAHDEDGRLRFRIGWFTDLSERSREERLRREAERQFETAFAKGGVGMALLDLDGRWLRANAAFHEITGYGEEELGSLTLAEIGGPDRLAADGGDRQLEKRYLRKDGETVWVLLVVSLLRDEEGEPVHYLVHAHDITLRKRMEKDLGRAATGSSLPGRDLMCTTGPDGRVDRLGGRWQEVLGFSEQELRSRPLREFIHPEDEETTAEELSRSSLRDGDWRTFRNRWKTKDGDWRWLAWSVFPLLGRERFYCSIREVDELVAIERALDLRGEVIGNMAEGVCLVTMADLRIAYANPSLERLLGYEPGELAGRHGAEVLRPSDLSEEERRVYESAEGRARGGGRTSFEVRRRRKDGSPIWCRTTTTTFAHPEYGPVWVAVMQDVSEERRAREASARLARAKGEFFGSVSHELRTPLTSILGYTALLREDLGEDGEAAAHLEVIERNASRQLRLVEDLLSIARIQAGEFEVHRLPTELGAVVAQAAEELRPIAVEARVELVVEAAPPVPILGDSDRLAQVVSNLVSNAIKFTPPRGRVEVAVRAERERALLTVSDTGPGVSAAERSRLFERMFRSEDVKRLQVDGAGLGLAIARSIVEAHSGTIDVRTADSGGAVFEVAVPLLLETQRS
jgi:PAS domain S-box-containing protein